MRIDLHTHSNRSDGTDSPADLVRNARAAGLDVVALTDHDHTVGWDEAVETAADVGIGLVRGIEISTTFQGHSVHLLGYEFDQHDGALNDELERVRQGRDQRIPTMLAKLAEQGYPITMEDLTRHSRDAAASGRPHFADALVEKYPARFPDRDAVFDGWLNDGGLAYVKRYSAPLQTAIELIKAAGGLAVVAHPWSSKRSRVLTRDVFAALVDAGLDGIEVDHNDHDEATRVELRSIANELDLVVTGSSDYHGTGKKADFFLGCNTTHPDEYERLFGR